MLKEGLYIAENNSSIYDSYRIKMKVHETEKSYIFELVDFYSRYSAAHIEMLFKKSKRVVINKAKSSHAIRIWSDHDFTFYPYQAGVPYWFKLEDLKGEDV